MRKVLLCSLILFLVGLGVAYSATDFYVYMDKNSPQNHFIPSGFMGDYGDLKLSDQSADDPFSGTTAIEITYTASRSGGQGWAGIYWQSSEHNWGLKDTGFDLSGFNKLSFRARGKNGGEVITLVKVGGLVSNPSTGQRYPFADTLEVEYGPVRLSKDWQDYSINLAGKDLSYINGGFALIFSADQTKGEQTIYLDDIRYSYDSSLKEEAAGLSFPFYVYADSGSLDNHYIPSGWMPGAASAQDIKMNAKSTENPYSGDTCIRIEYKDNSGNQWAGIYWQNPAGNWGSVPNAGYNLQGAKKLTFWARGEKGGEVINEFKVGGLTAGSYIDSDTANVGPLTLTKDWKKYEIDLRGKDLSYIIGGFAWATNIKANDPSGIVFYVDEIRYESE